jgi:peptidoglycan/LPS O-acetylase OafA/YrhL
VFSIITVRLTLHFIGYESGYWLASTLRFGTTFGIGILFYYYKEILGKAAYVLPFLGAAAIFYFAGAVAEISSPLIALSLLNLALSIKGPLLAYNRLGDYSYGAYIYAFPIQQSLVHFFTFSPLSLALTASAVTISVAVASWHFVELPCSRLLRKH